MEQPLDLNIALTQSPSGSPPDALATIAVRYDSQGLFHTGDILTNPLSSEEEENLRWYLEEYWKWPFEQFRERAEEVERLLPLLGKRLYQEAFRSIGAQSVLQAWRLQPANQRQISIVSDIPRVLSLPWELLHDEQGFLALRARHPVSIMRRLPQKELPPQSMTFEPPLRILLVTARPDNAGFVDPRCIVRELLEEVSEQVEEGKIALEFLRPPTLKALRERLSDTRHPPVHVLHFDGHGAFAQEHVSQDGLHFRTGGPSQGLLAFENDEGKEDLVAAGELAQILQDSGIRLAIFNACQSAVGAMDDVFSSVATRLIQGGIDAVVAMSASVLVACATRYVEGFYRALAAGVAVPVAQERARQALHDDPHRHLAHRYQEDEGEPVRLRDWWLPHYYQQRPLLVQPSTSSAKAPSKQTRKKQAGEANEALPVFNRDMPAEPRYGFNGRALELLKIERALLQKRLVVISGFGGMGKTALAREAADWFTRTGFYQRACFISYESGGNAATLLSTLGHFLGVYDSSYDTNKTPAALTRIQQAVKKQRLLVIADNLETILPGGEAVLEPAERAQLWNVLQELRKMGVGVLLTTRGTVSGENLMAPGKYVMHLPLRGLFSEDAYWLATGILKALDIDRACASYAELRELLTQLDHHPLAIQLVLPSLRKHSLATIRTEFAELLNIFVDDTVEGKNHSLLASLEYSLRQLNSEQRALVLRLAVFEGGASEDGLLFITQIPKAMWATLRDTLERAALLTVEQIHETIPAPFLHFHPVLIPFLRHQAGAEHTEEQAALQKRYAGWYFAGADNLSEQDAQYPFAARALVWRELPNLKRALDLLLQAGEEIAVSRMANHVAQFLTNFGLLRERDQMRQRVERTLTIRQFSNGILTDSVYGRVLGSAEDELRSGNVSSASRHLEALLRRIEGQPEGTKINPGSYEHAYVLHLLGLCLREVRQLGAAEKALSKALSLLDALLKRYPEDRIIGRLRASVLTYLGTVFREQGQYVQAQEQFEQALKEQIALRDDVNRAGTLVDQGTLFLKQGDYDQARAYYQQSLDLFYALRDQVNLAIIWHQLGRVAENQKEWAEAERCYRESLTVAEEIGYIIIAASACRGLAYVVNQAGRPNEAEGWYRGALQRIERMAPEGNDTAFYLNGLANLLLEEVKAGRFPRTRLDEARGYAEHALRIWGQLGVSDSIWTIYGILAQIAELEGQAEIARDYRQRERESYASFLGNRYWINQEHRGLIAAIALAAREEEHSRAHEAILTILEEKGWSIGSVVQRIWAGERDWYALTGDVDPNSALLVLRVLEMLESPPGMSSLEGQQAVEHLIASLPPAIVEPMVRGDNAAIGRVYEALSSEERQTVVDVLMALQSQRRDEGEEEDGDDVDSNANL